VEHLSEQIIHRHRQRKLTPIQVIALERHLAHCDQCQLLWANETADVNEVAMVLYGDLFSANPAADDHLSYEALEALVDSEASDVDREIAEVHLEVCSQCTADLTALEELRDQKPIMVPDPVQFHIRSFFGWGTWRKFAAISASLLLATFVWIVWKSQRSSVETTESQIAVSATPSPVNVSSPIPAPSPSLFPEIVVSLHDAGGIVTLDNTGKIEGLGELPPTLNTVIKTALTTEQLNVGPAIAGLRGKGGTLMGSGSDGTPFRLLSPLGVVVQSDRPTFRWEPYEGAAAYVVKVYDSNFKELATSLSQTATSWKIAASLPRGSVYTWQVTAVKDGEEIKSPNAPAPEARFRVLAQERVDEILRAQNIKPTSHLALGTLYAEAGLLEEARREFRILLQANPESKIVQKLLQEVSRN
jgi:hypothetical protein